jgi:hypothetical protein
MHVLTTFLCLFLGLLGLVSAVTSNEHGTLAYQELVKLSKGATLAVGHHYAIQAQSGLHGQMIVGTVSESGGVRDFRGGWYDMVYSDGNGINTGTCHARHGTWAFDAKKTYYWVGEVMTADPTVIDGIGRFTL